MRDYAPKIRLVAGPLQEEWMEHASCNGADLDLWFIERGASSAAAKRICAGCPVREDCLDYALDNDERYGIWGGLTEKERRPIKRARRLAS